MFPDGTTRLVLADGVERSLAASALSDAVLMPRPEPITVVLHAAPCVVAS